MFWSVCKSSLIEVFYEQNFTENVNRISRGWCREELVTYTNGTRTNKNSNCANDFVGCLSYSFGGGGGGSGEIM